MNDGEYKKDRPSNFMFKGKGQIDNFKKNLFWSEADKVASTEKGSSINDVRRFLTHRPP